MKTLSIGGVSGKDDGDEGGSGVYGAPVSKLSVVDHDRGSAGMTYVYPVVSRRAGGVSVGVNLNPNNACNWRCVYCQVPGLVRGKAPAIDLEQLESELGRMLDDVVHGDWMTEHVEAPYRRLNDVALSGNGEPTTAKALPEVMGVIERQLERVGVLGQIKVVMISNGSMMEQPRVQDALRHQARLNGELWFKLDRATEAGIAATNSVRTTPEDHLRRLRIAAELVPTWIQTCMFARDGAPPDEAEVQAYLDALAGLVADEVPVKGVLLYGLARQSHQPEAEVLSPVPVEWLEGLGARIRAAGLEAKVTP